MNTTKKVVMVKKVGKAFEGQRGALSEWFEQQLNMFYPTPDDTRREMWQVSMTTAALN